MNKIAKLFVLAGVTFVLACGPKGPTEQEKETMRLDSIAKAEATATPATGDATPAADATTAAPAAGAEAPKADAKAADAPKADAKAEAPKADAKKK